VDSPFIDLPDACTHHFVGISDTTSFSRKCDARHPVGRGMYPQITINGQTQTLAPGAKIMSQQNTIMMPSTLMNNVYIVNYTLDNQGLVNMVWVLTKEELAQSQ